MNIIQAKTTEAAVFLDRLKRRREAHDPEQVAQVAAILEAVRRDGDMAVARYTKAFDGYEGPLVILERSDFQGALETLERPLALALERAAAQIRDFHERQRGKGFVAVAPDGSRLGQIVRPLERVGVYVPGGRAAYPSSVLMNAIPAKVAGVEEVLMATPPGRDGQANPVLLAAAALAGVDRIYLMGGAQACAAFAYGTASVPPVDKLTGPGNSWVALAKQLLYGVVDIDMIAGPSEILIVADGSVPAEWAAADLLSQAEHDPEAAAILVTPDAPYAEAVAAAVARQMAEAPRRSIMEASIADHGTVILVEDLPEALAMANRIAPEHLELLVRAPAHWLEAVRHAGSVFLGPYTPEAVGDYMAGTNHVLPTSGTARFFSPLGVESFSRRMQYAAYSEERFREEAEAIMTMAEAEGLHAHGASVKVRLTDA